MAGVIQEFARQNGLRLLIALRNLRRSHPRIVGLRVIEREAVEMGPGRIGQVRATEQGWEVAA